jgi:hypothetical protein
MIGMDDRAEPTIRYCLAGVAAAVFVVAVVLVVRMHRQADQPIYLGMCGPGPGCYAMLDMRSLAV